MSGEVGVAEVTNYLGEPVLSAYAPVDILGMKWALLAEITRGEAYQASAEMAETASQAAASLIAWNTGLAVIATIVVIAVSSSRTRQQLTRRRPIGMGAPLVPAIRVHSHSLARRVS